MKTFRFDVSESCCLTYEIEAENEDIASEKIKESCEKLLANQIMETYEFTLNKI